MSGTGNFYVNKKANESAKACFAGNEGRNSS
jgi:hypothetical protein